MQIRNVAYHALDTSTLFNQRLSNVLKPGVYRGYRIRRNIADPSLVDLTHGEDGASVLLTVEGVRIEEEDEIQGLVRIQAADSTFSRYDLIVAEYQWTPNNAVEQVYRVIRGVYQRDTTLEPVRPQPATIYQIPLAWILVRPMTSLRGEYRVNVTQDDIFHALKASEVASPYDVASLKPELDQTNLKRIYVNAGIFPNATGSSFIEFGGGYSAEIDDTAMADGETRFFMFGISDDKVIDVAGESETLLTVPELGADILPLCVVEATKRGTTTTIDRIIDIRFPFTRRILSTDEESLYREYLRQSVFSSIRIDICDIDTLFDLDTLLPSDSNLTAVMNRGDTSLTITWAGTSAPSSDVTIATEDILSDTEFSQIQHLLVLADSDAAGVQFDYSTISGTSGFTGTYYDLGTIQEIVGGATNHIYLRFKIPAGQFPEAGTKKIFSYAVCLNLDYQMLNEHTLGSLGVDSIGYRLPNLIPNGDFFFWSRNDASDLEPDVYARDRIDYPIRKDDFASRENIFAADGWQFTKMTFDSQNSVISRVLWSRDALGSATANTIDTALEWKSSAWTAPPSQGQVLENHLELRFPIYGQYQGQNVTFALDYLASHVGAVGIELRFYERLSDGSLSVQDSVRTGITRLSGTLLAKSLSTISESTYAVGVVIVFQQLNVSTTVYVKDARAAIGRYEVLPYSRPEGSSELVRAYYERGKIFNSSSLRASNEVGSAMAYGTRKLGGLSEGTLPRLADLENRSVNMSAPTFTTTEYGFIVSGHATVDGLSILDMDWEASVIYPEVSGV